MDIRALVKEQVDALLQQSGGSQQQQIQVRLPNVLLEIELANLQPLGCALWQLEVRTDRTVQASTEELRESGQRLADRVKYLLEPLCVHEVDRDAAAMQMRSFPPERDERTVRYYEVTAESDGRWRLARYEKVAGEARHQVAAIVTIEVLQKLCQDVVAIAASA